MRFHVVVEGPFVVAGNEPAAIVRARATRLVRWTREKLRRAYFDRDPRPYLDVFLFRDRQSYERGVRALFHEAPSTPFGFYLPSRRAMVMNIGTGGGTLVHELVHPFVEANFPDCPTWLNEGLGSLYEASAERRGEIVGLTNWRLPGLKAAIKHGRLPSFRTLLATTTRQFYDEDPGTHYAQARYLLYYLQERGLLRELWRQVIASRHRDPTGYEALRRVLGAEGRDMDAFQRRWERYVLGLRWRGQ